MKKVCMCLVALTMIGACQGSNASRDETSNTSSPVHFEIDLAPSEGIPYVWFGESDVELRTAPLSTAPVRYQGKLSTDTAFLADSARFQTLMVAHFDAQTNGSIRGISYGSRTRLTRAEYYAPPAGDTTFTVSAGQTIEYLQVRAEGACFVRIDGLVVAAHTCPGLSDTNFVRRGEPQTNLWLHVTTPESFGWLNVDSSGVRIERRFD